MLLIHPKRRYVQVPWLSVWTVSGRSNPHSRTRPAAEYRDDPNARGSRRGAHAGSRTTSDGRSWWCQPRAGVLHEELVETAEQQSTQLDRVVAEPRTDTDTDPPADTAAEQIETVT